MASACPVCGKDSEIAHDREARLHRVACVRCGQFDVTEMFWAAKRREPMEADWRWRLSCALREATDRRRQLEPITLDNYKEITDRAQWPMAPLEQVDVLLTEIAKRTTFVGSDTSPDSIHAWAARIYLPDQESLQLLNKQISGLGYFDYPANYASGDEPKGFWYRLKPHGWRQAAEIRRARGPGNQAFVAMWFLPTLDSVYDLALAPALREVGYEPYRVDRDHHNDRIDNRIEAEIRRSRILVAECTGGRRSVYFEAGYGLARDLEVVWCCHSKKEAPPTPGTEPFLVQEPPEGGDWFSQLAFDTRQYSFLLWSSLEDLRIKVVNRIRARGLDLSLRA